MSMTRTQRVPTRRQAITACGDAFRGPSGSQTGPSVAKAINGKAINTAAATRRGLSLIRKCLHC